VKLVEGFVYDHGSFLWIMNNLFFQYYSIIILAVSALVMVIVSLMTAPPAYDKISGLTTALFPTSTGRPPGPAGRQAMSLPSIVVVLLILAAYLYFTG